MNTFTVRVKMERQEMRFNQISKTTRCGFRALRIQQVLDKTGLSRTHTYRLIAQGDHPKPIQLSERVFVWNEADIDAWLEAKFGGDEA